jgi:hypothetical protein
MKRLGDNVLTAFETYPISMSAYVITMLFWAFIYYGMINISFLTPAPEGVVDYRGEGIMYGVLLVLFFSAVLLVITILNVVFQKNKSFYRKLSALIVISNLLLYSIGLAF